MKNLQSKADVLAGALTRDELKKVTGGIISQDTWMEMCLDGKFRENPFRNDGSIQDEIDHAINEAICEDQYDAM